MSYLVMHQTLLFNKDFHKKQITWSSEIPTALVGRVQNQPSKP